MAKPRIHEIAHELGVDGKTVMQQLALMGEFYKSPSSTIEPPVARKLRAAMAGQRVPHRIFEAITESPSVLRQHLRSLPGALPELARTLTGTEKTVHERTLAKAVKAGAFFFVPAADAETIDARPDSVSIAVWELPAQAGVVALEIEDGARLLFWAFDDGRLSCWALTIHAGGDQGPVTVTRPDRGEGDVVDGVVEASSSVVGLLRQILDLAPRADTAATDQGADHRRRYRGELARVVMLTYRRPPAELTGNGSTRQPAGAPRDDGVRWRVRGHWRRQWYPSTKEHRTKWIAEHTAGAVEGQVAERDRILIVRAGPTEG